MTKKEGIARKCYNGSATNHKTQEGILIELGFSHLLAEAVLRTQDYLVVSRDGREVGNGILFVGKNFREDNAASTKAAAREIITRRQ